MAERQSKPATRIVRRERVDVPEATVPEPEVLEPPRPTITVLLPDGSHADRAEVEFLRVGGSGVDAVVPRPHALGRTDAHGVLAWPDVELDMPGVIRASKADLAPGTTPVSRANVDVVVQLSGGFVLAGDVKTTDGTPVEGARIDLRVSPTRHAFGVVMGVVGTSTRRAVTGRDGTFEVRGVQPAAFGVIDVDVDGFASVRRFWAAREGRVHVRLHRHFESVVRLVDGTGRPVLDGAVAAVAGPLFRAAGDGVAPAVEMFTPRSGAEHVREDLPPGWYTLLAAAPGHAVRVVEDVGLGPGTGSVEIVLEACDGLEGQVVDADTGEPVVGARVVIAPLAPGARPGSDDEWRHQRHAAGIAGPHDVRAGHDGTFRVVVTGPGGDFGLFAVAPGYAPSQRIVRRASADALREVRLDRLLDVQVSGRVVTEDGAPIPGALVRGGLTSVVADPAGRFVLATEQDGPAVTVFAPGFAGRSLIAAEARAELGDIVLTPVVEIPGTVVDEAGQPVAGLPLYVEPVGRLSLPPQTLFHGAYEVSATDGSAVAMVTPGDAYTIRPQRGTRSGETTVVGGEDTSFLLVVGPDVRGDHGRIVGRLELPDGTWEPRRVAVAVRSDDRPPPGCLGVALPDGSFEIDAVPAGRWDLRVVGGGVSGEIYDVAVPAAGEVRVRIVCEGVPDDGAERAMLAVVVEELTEDVRVWTTRQPGGTGRRAAPRPEGTWTALGLAGARYAVWAYDREGRSAAVLTAATPGDDPPHLRPSAAGRLFLPPHDISNPERWLELTDASGARVWFGPESALPGVPGEGYYLPLPPGDWTVEVGLGRTRKNPRRLRGTVRRGDATRLE